MAIPWLSVLQAVPWSDVLAQAPKVVDAAGKLWRRTRQRAPGPAGTAGPPSPEELPERLLAAENRLAELQQELAESSELLKELADQNAQLLRGLEAGRQRLRRLQWLLGLTALLALAALLR